MSKINDGGNAFPGKWHSQYDGEHFEKGMSLRDYFAGQALVGLSARGLASEQAARIAYRKADAMLRAREAIHDEG